MNTEYTFNGWNIKSVEWVWVVSNPNNNEILGARDTLTSAMDLAGRNNAPANIVLAIND